MKNFLCFTTVNGTTGHAEFVRIEYIRPVIIADTCSKLYYNIKVTGVVYTDTGDTAEKAQFFLYTRYDRVKYLGKTYEFGDLARLCMVVENENNLAALETL